MPQYWVENTHEAIIPLETYRAVQEERQRRRELGVFANWSINTSCFTSKIKCGNCGVSYRRSGKRQRKDKDEVYYVWVCQTYDRKGKATCPAKAVPESKLKTICAEVLGLTKSVRPIPKSHLPLQPQIQGRKMSDPSCDRGRNQGTVYQSLQ